MSGTSVASRRFYRAFYEWSLLTAPAGVSISGARGHGYHTTSRRQEGEPRLTIRKFNKRPESSGTGATSRTRRTRSAGDQRTEHGSLIQTWKAVQVQTATERPFSTLSPGEAIVRYRSEYGLMIEYAALSTDLVRMQKKFGNRLEGLSRKHGVRIEVQTLTAPVSVAESEGARIVSVLISGSFAETAAIYNAMRSYRSPAKEPEELAAEKQGLHLPVFSHLARPSTSLTPREFLVRESRKGTVTMEVSVLEGNFMKYVVTSSVSSISEKFNVSVNVGEPEPRPVNTTSSETSLARSFIISGPFEKVRGAKDYILNAIISKITLHESISMRSASKDGRSATTKAGATPIRNGPRTQRLSSDATSTSRSSSHPFGKPAEEYEVCHARIVGPSATILRDRLGDDKKLADFRKGMGVGNWRMRRNDVDGFIFSGSRPNVAQLQHHLKTRADELCKALKIETHGLEYRTSPALEHFRQQDNLVSYQYYIRGPNCQDLWAIIMDEFKDGLRSVGPGDIVKIEKGKEEFTASGGPQGLDILSSYLGDRVKLLCSTHDFPKHSVIHWNAKSRSPTQLVDDVRDELRNLTHPVVLVTSTEYAESSEQDADISRARGVTVSSFNTVTLHPQPVVSFNLKLPSRTWDAIRSSGAFVVNLLAATPRGAAIAHTFTQAHDEPSQGFRELQNMGVGVAIRGNTPPVMNDSRARGLLAGMRVHLALSKCIEVEDHVIVVGIVGKVFHTNSSEPALSYTSRAYQGADGVIKPDYTPVLAGEPESSQKAAEQPHRSEGAVGSTPALKADFEEELDPLDLGEEIDPQPKPDDVPVATTRKQRLEQVSNDNAEPIDDPVYRALTRTRKAIGREERAESDLYEKFNNDDQGTATTGRESIAEHKSTDELAREAKRRAAVQEEEEYDFGFDEPEHGNKSFTTTEEVSPQVSQPSSRPAHAWGMSSSISTRSYSTFARPLSMLSARTNQPYRSVSTSAAQISSSNNLSRVLDPALAQSTVSDYLSLSEEPLDREGRSRPFVKQRSVRGALKDKRDIVDLKDLLSKGYRVSAQGDEIPLTPEEIANSKHKIVVLERKVCVTLAQNAMWHLQAMLDKARYTKLFWEQAPFLEKLIEQGMATLMDDARDLRKMLDEGKVEKERYEYLSGKLKGRYEGMEIETGRLRQITEEEGDGGVRDADDDEDW